MNYSILYDFLFIISRQEYLNLCVSFTIEAS